jgi:hypothetical protein
MSEQRSRLLSMIGAFWMVVLVCSALSGTVLAADDQDQDDATLVGTWRNSILFAGVPIEFFSLTVFNAGGTMTDRFAGGNTGPGLSVGNGVWKKIRGRDNFAATFEIFNDSDSDGVFDQRFRIGLTIHLLDRDRFTATCTVNDTVSLDGTTLLGAGPGCTVRSTRMLVIPE